MPQGFSPDLNPKKRLQFDKKRMPLVFLTIHSLSLIRKKDFNLTKSVCPSVSRRTQQKLNMKKRVQFAICVGVSGGFPRF